MDFFIIIDSASATQSVTSEGSVVIARETDKTEIMICYENFFFFWIFEFLKLLTLILVYGGKIYPLSCPCRLFLNNSEMVKAERLPLCNI